MALPSDRHRSPRRHCLRRCARSPEREPCTTWYEPGKRDPHRDDGRRSIDAGTWMEVADRIRDDIDFTMASAPGTSATSTRRKTTTFSMSPCAPIPTPRSPNWRPRRSSSMSPSPSRSLRIPPKKPRTFCITSCNAGRRPTPGFRAGAISATIWSFTVGSPAGSFTSAPAIQEAASPSSTACMIRPLACPPGTSTDSPG
jgi:hypothetical protein